MIVTSSHLPFMSSSHSLAFYPYTTAASRLKWKFNKIQVFTCTSNLDIHHVSVTAYIVHVRHSLLQ